MRLENSKFSLKIRQGMQYTFLEWQWLTLSKHLEHGSRNLFRLQKASVFSAMADACTDIMAVEELPVFCCWKEDGTPVRMLFGHCAFKESRC